MNRFHDLVGPPTCHSPIVSTRIAPGIFGPESTKILIEMLTRVRILTSLSNSLLHRPYGEGHWPRGGFHTRRNFAFSAGFIAARPRAKFRISNPLRISAHRLRVTARAAIVLEGIYATHPTSGMHIHESHGILLSDGLNFSPRLTGAARLAFPYRHLFLCGIL